MQVMAFLLDAIHEDPASTSPLPHCQQQPLLVMCEWKKVEALPDAFHPWIDVKTSWPLHFRCGCGLRGLESQLSTNRLQGEGARESVLWQLAESMTALACSLLSCRAEVSQNLGGHHVPCEETLAAKATREVQL